MENREVLNKLLLEANQIAKSIDLKFFLTYGVLLGCYRDGQIINIDGDVDLGSLQDGGDPAFRSKIVQAFEDRGFKTNIIKKDTWQGAYNLVFIKEDAPQIKYQGVSITPSIAFKFIKRVGDEYMEAGSSIHYPIDVITPLKQIQYLGETFSIPNKPEVLCKEWYDEGWKIPSRQAWIIRGKEPIELYPVQGRAYRASDTIEVFLQSDKNGEYIKPYIMTGITTRGRQFL